MNNPQPQSDGSQSTVPGAGDGLPSLPPLPQITTPPETSDQTSTGEQVVEIPSTPMPQQVVTTDSDGVKQIESTTQSESSSVTQPIVPESEATSVEETTVEVTPNTSSPEVQPMDQGPTAMTPEVPAVENLSQPSGMLVNEVPMPNPTESGIPQMPIQPVPPLPPLPSDTGSSLPAMTSSTTTIESTSGTPPESPKEEEKAKKLDKVLILWAILLLIGLLIIGGVLIYTYANPSSNTNTNTNTNTDDDTSDDTDDQVVYGEDWAEQTYSFTPVSGLPVARWRLDVPEETTQTLAVQAEGNMKLEMNYDGFTFAGDFSFPDIPDSVTTVSELLSHYLNLAEYSSDLEYGNQNYTIGTTSATVLYNLSSSTTGKENALIFIDETAEDGFRVIVITPDIYQNADVQAFVERLIEGIDLSV